VLLEIKNSKTLPYDKLWEFNSFRVKEYPFLDMDALVSHLSDIQNAQMIILPEIICGEHERGMRINAISVDQNLRKIPGNFRKKNGKMD
jgi:hypothetical protein